MMVNTISHSNLSPRLQLQYKFLKLYSFLWWAFYSTLIVFQPLYLFDIGVPLWGIFLNSAFGAITSLLFENFWSNIADQKQSYKLMMIFGNLFIAGACFFIIFIENYWMVLFLTFLLRCGPFSDGFITVLVYRIADHIEGRENVDQLEKKFHQINIYSQQRKFGSIGWAIMLPIIAIFVNIYGIGINFIVGGIGMILLSVMSVFLIDEGIILEKSNSQRGSQDNSTTVTDPVKIKSQNIGLIQQFRLISKNKLFMAFLIASLIFSAAQNLTYEVQGIFYSMFANDNYIILVLIYSVAAFMEWPIMTLVASRVKSIGWEKMIVIVYIMTGLNLSMVPLILLFNGTIWFGYIIQIVTGIIFGLRQPSTTFGLYSSLEKNQKSLGQSFYHTITLIGAFFGHLGGAIISYFTPDGSSVFYGIYWVASIIAILSAVLFQFIKPKK